jgi:uncharacterized protein with HEPN domain
VPRRDWRLRVADMLDAAEMAISLAAGLDRAKFLDDRVLVDAAIKNVTVIGEAATHVPDDVTERWPEIPWRDIRDMRNFIVHEYFGVNPGVLWGTVREDLPTIVPVLRRMLEGEQPPAG